MRSLGKKHASESRPARWAPAVLLLLGLVLAPAGPNDSQAQPALGSERPLHVYLLLGQSNMGGRGEIAPEDRLPVSGVRVFTEAGRWAPAAHPLQESLGGVGPGIDFARTLIEAGEQADIGLVPCAVGNSTLERWTRGGDLYEQALRRAQAALAGSNAELRGILWHQGERETGYLWRARLYAPRLRSAIEDLRRDLGDPFVPFVVGGLGEFLHGRSNHPYVALVDQSLVQVAEQVPFAALAPSRGLEHGGDFLHFDAASARELGRRYGAAFLDLRRVHALARMASVTVP